MFTLRLIADNSWFHSDHDKTEWEVYEERDDELLLDIYKEQHKKRNRLDERTKEKLKNITPFYYLETDEDLVAHDVLLPHDHDDLDWGANLFYVRFRFHSASKGWSKWSPLWPCTINKAKEKVEAFSRGPIEKNNSSKGLLRWNWKVEMRVGDGVYIARENIKKTDWRTPEFLFTPQGDYGKMIYLDLTFDQNGRVFVCYEIRGEIWLYYYDSREGDHVLTNICSGRCPQINIDWRNYFGISAGETDVLLFYIDDNLDEIVYRQQRDHFLDVYSTGMTGVGNKYLKMLDYDSGYRFVVISIEKGDDWLHPSRYTDGNCFNFRKLSSAPYFVENLEEFQSEFDLSKIVKTNSQKNIPPHLVVNQASLTDDCFLKQMLWYYNFNSPYEYLVVNQASLTDDCFLKQMFWYVNKYSPYEYLVVNQVSMTEGVIYVP